MKKVCFAVLGLLVCAPAVAQDSCPVPEAGGDPEKILAAINEASDCTSAADLARSCASGTSVDVGLTSAAIQRCEKDFARITRAERAMYTQLSHRCEKKYAKERGTMYRSAASFCRLDVAATFSNVFGPIER